MELMMRKTKRIGLLLWLMCALNIYRVPVVANTDANNVDEKAYVNPGNMFPNVRDLPASGVKLEEQKKRYLGERGWEEGVSSTNPGNAYIGWATAPIRLGPDDVKYGQARIMAFHRAFTDAKGAFVLSRRLTVLTEIAREFLLDEFPEDIPDTDKFSYIRDRLLVAAEKGADLGEAYLDKLLTRFGIDPTYYQKVDRVERKKILNDAIARTVKTRAISSLAGLRIVTTFEDLESVGVLVMYSEQSERIARQVVIGEAVSRRPADVVKRSIQDMLAKALPNDADYIGVHGVRIMQDDAGENVLVAFGQWSPNITKTTSRPLIEGYVRAAREVAQQEAYGTLTDFAKSTLDIETVARTKEFQDISLVTQSGRQELEPSYAIGQRVETIIRQHGSAKLEGATTIRTWTLNNPRTGHVLVGHVLMWSPSTRDAARGKFLKQEEGKPAEKVKYDNTVIEAPPLDHLDPTLRRK